MFVCMHRGVSDLGSAEPVAPLDTVRQLFGQGVRAGLYPLSPARWYWYVCWNCPAVSLSLLCSLLEHSSISWLSRCV